MPRKRHAAVYLLELYGVIISISGVEIVLEGDLRGFAELVTRLGVRHALYHSTLQRSKGQGSTFSRHAITDPHGSGHHSIRHEVEVQADSPEDVLEELHDLEGQHVLSDIIPDLEDAALPYAFFLEPFWQLCKGLWTGEGGSTMLQLKKYAPPLVGVPLFAAPLVGGSIVILFNLHTNRRLKWLF